MPEPKRILQEVALALRSRHPIKLSEALTKLDQLDQSDPTTWEYRAHVYFALGKENLGSEAAQTAYEVSGRADYFAGVYADTLIRTGHAEQGVALFESLIERGTKAPTNYLALSQRYISTGDAPAALRILSAAEDNAASTVAEAIFGVHRAIALVLTGEIPKAKRATLELLSAITGKPYRRFSEVPPTVVAAVNIEGLPAKWVDAFAKTIVAWVREDASGIQPRLPEIWSIELLQAVPYDDEPLTQDEISGISLGMEALNRGEVFSLDDIEREFGLL